MNENLDILSNEIYKKRRDRRIKKIIIAFEIYLSNLKPETSRWTIIGALIIGGGIGALIVYGFMRIG